jgi:excisionase family DNA binding protein
MYLSIKETAGILKISEKSVWNFIASGVLAVERVGQQVLVRRESVESLLATGFPVGLDSAGGKITGEHEVDAGALEKVLDRLTSIEGQVEDLFSIVRENYGLFHELREKDALLALKEVELEKLQRDLLYQKRICDKEIEHHRKHYEEQSALLKEENSEKIALERRHFEEKLAAENARWAERLSGEQENFNLKLSRIKEREGLWAKLVKMMTWS